MNLIVKWKSFYLINSNNIISIIIRDLTNLYIKLYNHISSSWALIKHKFEYIDFTKNNMQIYEVLSFLSSNKMNRQKVIGERKVRTKNTEMRVIKWERVGNDKKKKKRRKMEKVCVCVHARTWEREQWMIFAITANQTSKENNGWYMS